ncbi:MAG: ABC transporter ATP-binding protein [Candidatus Competibacterales bacterium]
MVEITDLQFAYPHRGFGLCIPSLTIASEEKLAVVGPSGTGKTTLLNLIAGLISPRRGCIRVGDTDVCGLSDGARRRFRARNIGFIFQDFALLDYLTVRENILYPYRITPALKLDGQVRQRAQGLAVACGLGDKLQRRPGALSQGEQQRVAICRALITQPRLLLADEATGNLDPDNKSLILGLLFERIREARATLIAVTHDHDLLPHFDRVVDFAAFGQA